jgi:hypothetical protein
MPPSPVELYTLPAIVESGPNLVLGIFAKHINHHPPTVATWLVAIEFQEAIVAIWQLFSPTDE